MGQIVRSFGFKAFAFAALAGCSALRRMDKELTKQITSGCSLITGVLRTTQRMRQETLHNASIIMGYGEMVRVQLYNKEIVYESRGEGCCLQYYFVHLTTRMVKRKPLDEIGRNNCEYFTVMRHPIDRLVSAFYYCPTDHDVQNRPKKESFCKNSIKQFNKSPETCCCAPDGQWCGDSKGHPQSLETRLIEFAEMGWGNRAYLMMMHSFLCDPGFELCDQGQARDLHKRPQNLETSEGRKIHNGIKQVLSTFVAVGIFEEWEVSMHLFDARVRSSVRHWDVNLVVNLGVQTAEREALLEWAHTAPRVHSLLSADLLLYDFALSLFRKQTRQSLGREWRTH